MTTDENYPPVIKAALVYVEAYIRKHYENVPYPQRLFYHVFVHTFRVFQRVLALADALGLSRQDALRAMVAGLFHDTCQAWHSRRGEGGVEIRERHSGPNERESAGNAVVWATLYPYLQFAPEDLNIIKQAIPGTIPAWDEKYATVFFPALTPECHPVLRALCLADLGSAGMDPTAFAQEGLQLFAEEQIDVTTTLLHARVVDDISESAQASYRGRLITYLDRQAAFARGRQDRLTLELEGLPKEHKNAVRELFRHFPASIELAKANVERARTQSFLELGRSLIPEAFPDEPRP